PEERRHAHLGNRRLVERDQGLVAFDVQHLVRGEARVVRVDVPRDELSDDLRVLRDDRSLEPVRVGALGVAVGVAGVGEARGGQVLLQVVGAGAVRVTLRVEAGVRFLRQDEELTLPLRGQGGEDRRRRLPQRNHDGVGVGRVQAQDRRGRVYRVDQVLAVAALLRPALPGKDHVLRVQETAVERRAVRRAGILADLERQGEVVRRELPLLREVWLRLAAGGLQDAGLGAEQLVVDEGGGRRGRQREQVRVEVRRVLWVGCDQGAAVFRLGARVLRPGEQAALLRSSGP